MIYSVITQGKLLRGMRSMLSGLWQGLGTGTLEKKLLLKMQFYASFSLYVISILFSW